MMLHMNLHWRNDVFGFLGLERDQLLQVTCAQSRCFWCQIIFAFFGPFHVLKAECSRDRMYVLKKGNHYRPSLVLWMYPSCFSWLNQPSWNLKKLGGISGCVGLNEWVAGFLNMYGMDD